MGRLYSLADPTPVSAPAPAGHGVSELASWLDRGVAVGGVKLTVASLLGALLVLALFLVASALVRRVLNRYGQTHRSINQSSLYTVERLVHYLLLVIGLLWALTVAGVPVAKMTVFAGAIGVGLGFGLQAIFNNFVSGLILLFERSLKVGDFVELASGVHGTVRDIHIRATRISTNDNIDILVPNSEFVSGRVVNWTLNEAARRQKIPFGVAYGTDKELVRKAALEAVAAVPFTLCQDGPRAPQVWLTGFGDSSLNFQLTVWLTPEATRRPGSVAAAYNWALHTALVKYGIEIPFPQRDLHVRSWPESRPETAPPLRPDEPIDLADNDAARDVQRGIAEAAAAPSSPAGYPSGR